MKHNLCYLAILTGLALPLHATTIAALDFSDGNITDDDSGNSVAMTLTGTATLNPDGFSAQFADGSNFLTGDLNHTSGNPYTASFWFSPDSASPGGNSSAFSTNGTNDWQFEHTGNVRLHADAGTTTSTFDLTLDQWYHVAFVSDGTGFELFVTEATPGGTTVAVDLSEATGNYDMADFRLGTNRGQNVNWEGDYAFVTITDTAENLAGVQALYNANINTVAPIPEPSSAALLGMGALAMAMRRSKG